MCFQLANSVAQLGFGHVADRSNPRILLIGGPLLAVAMLPLIGLAPTAWVLAAVLIVGGLGGAAFHPPAAALVHRYAGQHRGFAMSFHITSGTLGQAMAPLLFAPFVQRFGLRGMPWLVMPGLAVLGGVLLRRVPSDRAPARIRSGGRILRSLRIREAAVAAVPDRRAAHADGDQLFDVRARDADSARHDDRAGRHRRLHLSGAVGAGGFFGGPIADRFGARRVIMLSLVWRCRFSRSLHSFNGWSLVATIAVGGFLLQSTLPVNVTFAQTIAPISAATVSSLMMGFAWGIGGLAAPLVGMVADRIGIERHADA